MSQNEGETARESSNVGQDSVNVNLPADQGSDEPNQAGQQTQTPSGYKYGIFKRQIRYDPLSIVFAVLVFIGGLVGYLTKQSLPSLIAGTIFALLIGICTYIDGARKSKYSSLPLLITLLTLGCTMLVRYSKNFVFFPSGFFALLALLMVGRHSYLLYLRKSNRV